MKDNCSLHDKPAVATMLFDRRAVRVNFCEACRDKALAAVTLSPRIVKELFGNGEKAKERIER